MPCAECLVMFVWSDQAFRNSNKARLAHMLGPAPFIRILWKLDVEPFDGSQRGGKQCLIPFTDGFVFKSLVLQCFLDLRYAPLLWPEDKQMSKLSWWPSIPLRPMIKLQFSTLFCTCGQWYTQTCLPRQFTHISRSDLPFCSAVYAYLKFCPFAQQTLFTVDFTARRAHPVPPLNAQRTRQDLWGDRKKAKMFCVHF